MAIEIKAIEQVVSHHLKGLKAFGEEYKTKHSIVVSLDPKPRILDGISILPWETFLKRLWAGELLK